MVEREIVRLVAAVLAGVAVTGEDFAAGQLDAGPGPADLVLQADDGGRTVLLPRRPDHLMVVLDDLRLLAEDQPEGSWQVADV